MSRAVEEWVAKHDDQKVPPRVRQRVYDAHDGICHITGQQIQTGDLWELEHKVALILGGEHRERNLAPALKAAHKKKTALEMAIKSKIAKVRQKHTGAVHPAGKIKSAPFPTPDKPARAAKVSLAPRRLFEGSTS
jgi:5-methylcytosine-specific restriction endonuclease McrA